MTEPGELVAGPVDIRFDRVEPQEGDAAAATCGTCSEPLAGSYFEIGGEMVCAACREGLAAELSRGTPLRRLVRSLAAGLVAAAIGAGIYYAVLALTGYEIGLIAIVVGLLVGGAVRWGSHGRGGWLYQGLAVGLTYVAIVSTYVPFLFAAAAEDARKTQPAITEAQAVVEPASDEAAGVAPPAQPAVPAIVTASTAGATVVAGNPAASAGGVAPEAAPAVATAVSEPPATLDAGVAPLGLGGMLLAMAVFAGVVLALPFLAGFGNFLGWIIIGFALFQAWKMNRKRQVTIAGPFQIAAGTGAQPLDPG